MFDILVCDSHNRSNKKDVVLIHAIKEIINSVKGKANVVLHI